MTQPLLIDSNLCVLLVVGATSPAYIARNKRLSAYDETDFQLLARFTSGYSTLLFSPNVLTETSNLLRYMSEPFRTEVSGTLSRLIEKTEEQYVSSSNASRRKEHARLGLTDSVLLTLCDTGATLITSDLDLYLAAINENFTAMNYNHIREARGDYQ
jgi:hypothetical protein